jgi:hypothetical protein
MIRAGSAEPIAVNPFCEYEPRAGDHAPFGHDREADCFHWIILARQGLRPLRICGRILLKCDNICVGLSTWSELTLYETRAGRFTISVAHHLTESLGGDWHDTTLHDSVFDLRRAIDEHDPMLAVELAPEEFATSCNQPCRGAGRIAAAGLFRGAWFGMVRALFGSGVR